MNTLGERIRQLRGKNSQAWLARQLSIPATTLSNYENGKSELNFAMIESITTIFKVNTDWLLFGHGPMSRDEGTATAPSGTAAMCARCVRLEEKLDRVERQRDGLMEENRQLLREHGDMKAELALLRERLKGASCQCKPVEYIAMD